MKRNENRKHVRRAIALLFSAMFLLAIALMCTVQAEEAADEQVTVKLENADPARVCSVYDIEAAEAGQVNDAIEDDMDLLAKLVWGEARGENAEEQSKVVWCVLNRCDDAAFPDTIRDVVTQDKPVRQFSGYNASNPVDESIRDICIEVWNQYCAEQRGETVYRTLGREFMYFHAAGGDNLFATDWQTE